MTRVELADGVGVNVEELGAGLPLVVLHGGPGLDHSMFRPYLDPLAEDVRLIYMDGRGQGRRDRVDPETLSLEVFAQDVDRLAEVLGLERFAILGHSFGAIVATFHAIELGTAERYVISGGGDSSEGLHADVEASLAALGEEGQAIVDSWEREKTVETEAELAELIRDQLPFHFAGPVPDGYGENMVFSPEVLRYFATAAYGAFDFVPSLRRVDRPVLVIVGEDDRTTTPRAARMLADGISGAKLVVLEGVGHMSFVEAQHPYLDAVRSFLKA